MKVDSSFVENTFLKLGIPIPPNKLVLLGFRGALPTENVLAWKNSQHLRAQQINYKHMRCSIGIWNPSKKKIFLVPGSTVPHYSQVVKSAEKGGKGSNQPEPGFYTDFYKGEHLMGKVRGHEALRQTANRFIRRSAHQPPYTQKDPLFFSNPYDNMHCSWNSNPMEEGFSSSGCIVVSGEPFCKRIPGSAPNSGPWKAFHKKIYSVSQKKFSLLLLDSSTWVKSQTTKSTLLCFGSEGEKVKMLQKLLKRKGLYRGPISGLLGARTYKAWNQYDFKML